VKRGETSFPAGGYCIRSIISHNRQDYPGKGWTSFPTLLSNVQ